MARQTMPQPLRIMKLMASGVAFSRGNDEIAFVLAVLVIHEHDHAARLEVGQGFVDGAEILRYWACVYPRVFV